MPRFTFEKFPGAEPLLIDLDEIGRRGDGDRPQLRRIGAEGAALDGDRARPASTRSRSTGVETRPARQGAVKAALAKPSPDRLLLIAQAYRHGLSTAEIHAACRYEPWFLERIREIVEAEERVRRDGLPQRPDRACCG